MDWFMDIYKILKQETIETIKNFNVFEESVVWAIWGIAIIISTLMCAKSNIKKILVIIPIVLVFIGVQAYTAFKSNPTRVFDNQRSQSGFTLFFTIDQAANHIHQSEFSYDLARRVHSHLQISLGEYYRHVDVNPLLLPENPPRTFHSNSELLNSWARDLNALGFTNVVAQQHTRTKVSNFVRLPPIPSESLLLMTAEDFSSSSTEMMHLSEELRLMLFLGVTSKLLEKFNGDSSKMKTLFDLVEQTHRSVPGRFSRISQVFAELKGLIREKITVHH